MWAKIFLFFYYLQCERSEINLEDVPAVRIKYIYNIVFNPSQVKGLLYIIKRRGAGHRCRFQDN